MTYHSKRRWRSADRCRRISTWAEAPVHLVGGHRAATTGPSSLGSPAAAENSASDHHGGNRIQLISHPDTGLCNSKPGS